MRKRFLALMLALIMVAALLPTAAFADAGSVTGPVANEDTSDGLPSSDETQPAEDLTGDEDLSSDSPSETPNLPDGEDEPDDGEDGALPSQDTDGPEADESAPEENPADEPTPDNGLPEDGGDPDGSDMGIASIALEEDDKAFMKNYFKSFKGEYTLPDGSGWKVTIDNEGNLTMECGDSKTTASVDSITKSGDSVKTVVFTSPNWWKSNASANQTLTLTWTAAVGTYAHKSFKCAATTLYNSDGKTVLKAFTTNSYFIADNGIFSYDYFAEKNEDDSYKYAGKYALSTEYGNTYGSDIAGIGDWYIEVAETGHVYLCIDEENKYEAVMTSGSTTNGIKRVNEMYAALPGWYTNASWTTPVYVKLTWGYDSISKSAGYGKGALYFTTAAQTTVYKQGVKTKVYLPAMRFERSDLTAFAKSKLAPFAGEYLVSDATEEKIVIEENGTVKLHTIDNTDLTPLYYVVDNTNWLEGNEEGAAVTSVVFSKKEWFAEAKKTAPSAERATVTMTWDTVSKQFAVSSDVTCYKEDSEGVFRIYSTAIRYSTEEDIKEGNAYMTQYVTGEYTLNDGSDWKIKVDSEGKVYTRFGTEKYVEVENPAPVFVQDTTYTSGDKEYGNKGKYLTTITVPVTGWYIDEECKQEAVVTLNWKGNVVNPIDDHQFNVTAIPVYRKTDGDTECKYLAGTFYSDADRKKGEDFLQSIGVAGAYHPTAAEGKWWIMIGDDGAVTVYATDSQGKEHSITDVAMDLTMDKKTTSHNNPNFGQITAVTDIKVVFPEWRTTKTNDTLENIAKCEEVTFTFTRDQNNAGSSYFTPSNTYIYADTKEDGSDWDVVTKSSAKDYNKDFLTKIYNNDRAYSDDNKEAAKKYFAKYAGTYYIEEAGLDCKITITEEGQIYWGDYASGKALLPADVAFDAIHDENGNNKVDPDETTAAPGTISVWLNGYTTAKVSTSNTKPYYTDGTQRADLTWNDTDEEDIVKSAHKFKTSGKSNVKGFLDGKTQTTFELNKYYTLGEEVTAEDFVDDGTYETTDAKFKIVIETDESTGETSYTFYRPDTPDVTYPLKLFSSGDAAYLRGKIGKMKKNDVYIVVTKGPYEGFLLTGYEVEYNDLNGKETSSSSAPTVVLPAGTRFTDYALGDTGTNKNIIVVEEGQEKEEGTSYSRLSLALHSLTGGETIYLEDDIKIGFEAKLPDNVENVTIDGQGHTITRDTFANPNTILMDPEISLIALEEEGAAIPQEHYTGAILQVGAGDEVTLKNVTIDGEGKWEIDRDKLEYDKKLNEDYDVNVLDDPKGGHPIKELEGNVVSTDSLIKVAGGTLILDGVTLENFFAGDGYDDRHFIDFMSTEDGKLEIKSTTVFRHNASRAGVCIGNTDKDEIRLNGFTTMQNNYCYGGNGGLIVAMEGTQVYMEDGTEIIDNVAADTNGVFIQLHKKTDGVKDGDNKGTIYSKLHMNGGEIGHNTGLRGGSYGWGQTVYLYNGGAFEMNGGSIHDNMGAGISSIYQQPSADALMLNAGEIYNNTCSLKDEGTDWALDIALMNIGTMGPDMFVGQNFVVGAAAILGGYASGDEYLTNNGVIKGNISVYSYFNNEGRVSTVVNNNTIDGDIRLENGSMIKNNVDGVITGNVTVRGALTESAGESSFHNEGDVKGNIELAEGAHLYNSGEVYGDVTVKSGGTLEMNCNEEGHTHGGVIHGDVYLYPDSLIYADVKPTQIDGTIYLEYDTEEDRDRMLDVIETCGIECANIVEKPHVHTTDYDETEEDSKASKCTDTTVILKACKTCGKVVERVESEPTGHDYYVDSIMDATCTTGKIENIRCKNCTAYKSPCRCGAGTNRDENRRRKIICFQV